jgi:hypothetical protein
MFLIVSVYFQGPHRLLYFVKLSDVFLLVVEGIHFSRSPYYHSTLLIPTFFSCKQLCFLLFFSCENYC